MYMPLCSSVISPNPGIIDGDHYNDCQIQVNSVHDAGVLSHNETEVTTLPTFRLYEDWNIYFGLANDGAAPNLYDWVERVGDGDGITDLCLRADPDVTGDEPTNWQDEVNTQFKHQHGADSKETEFPRLYVLWTP